MSTSGRPQDERRSAEHEGRPLSTAALAERLAAALRAAGATMATAESCTGGLVAAACTDLAGSSEWFERGFVTYSNAAKVDLLGVPEALIAAHGAVSEAVAIAMAVGALAASPARFAVAVTGIAGPGGGSEAKPVGTVWLAVAERGTEPRALRLNASGDRANVRSKAVETALTLIISQVSGTTDAAVARERAS